MAGALEHSVHFLALLGASMVLFSVVGKPSGVHPGYALTGFVLWLLGVVASCCSIGHPVLRSLFRGALSAAAADLAAEKKLDHFLLRSPRSRAGGGTGTGNDLTVKCSAQNQKPHQMSLAV